MPATRQVQPVSDSRRDASRYHSLLLALQSATNEIRDMEDRGRPDLGEVMRRLLPAFCESLDAAQGFVAVERSTLAPTWLEVVGTFPATVPIGTRLPWSGILESLNEDGKPKVVDSLDDGVPRLIPGLEIFRATSAVLVRTQRVGETWVIGVCNHRDSPVAPYLAADGKALDEMVELVTIGARIGERHRQELRSLQATSQAISGVLQLDGLLQMASAQTAAVFDAPATSVMLWDDARENLVIRAHCGLSPAYAQELCISRAALDAVIRRVGTEHPHVTPDLKTGHYGQADLILNENLATVLSAPLKVQGEFIGLLNIYSKGEPRDFTADEIDLTAVFANQVAIAVHNARLYEAARRETQHWQGLHAASKALSAGFSVSPRQVLDCIVAQAVDHSCSINGARPVSGILQLYDPGKMELRFESVYPPDLWPQLMTCIGATRSIDPEKVPADRIGITGRAVLERAPMRVADVELDPNYVRINQATRSELAVPLLDQRGPIGVLSLESSEIAAFDAHDEATLAALAELAVIAIRNAQQADRLSQANAVAMMGAWGANLAHAVNEEVGLIRLATYAIAQTRGLSPEVKTLLRDVDRHAGNLSMLEMPRLRARQGEAVEIRDAAFVDKVLRSEVESFQRDYPAVTWTSELACAEWQVAMHEQWLRQLLRLLMHNCAEAMKSGKRDRHVVVRSSLKQGMVEVQVEDTGPGIPEAVLPLLFHQPIPQRDRSRGQGLLLARFVAEQHGGTLGLSWSRPGEGSCFAFSIPTLRSHKTRRPRPGTR